MYKRQVQTIITRKDSQCTLYRDKPKVTQSTLIQKEIELTLQGFKCAVVHTRRVHYCGIWSYTQSIPVGYTLLPKRVSVAECQAMVRQQYYTEGGDKKYPLSIPGLTNLNLQRAGSERISDRQLRCDGADIQEGGTVVEPTAALHHDVGPDAHGGEHGPTDHDRV